MVIVYSLLQYLHQRKIKNITKAKSFSVGHILETRTMASRGFVVFYSFKLNEYDTGGGDITKGQVSELGSLAFVRSFPVIYNGKDPSENDILIFPDDFSKYNLPFPDSLKWVVETIEK